MTPTPSTGNPSPESPKPKPNGAAGKPHINGHAEDAEQRQQRLIRETSERLKANPPPESAQRKPRTWAEVREVMIAEVRAANAGKENEYDAVVARRRAEQPDKPPPQWPPPFPGPLHDAVQAVLAAAPKPREALATLGVLVGYASAISGRYQLPDGERLNLQATAILPTGGGKDIVREAAERICARANAAVMGKPASGAALEVELQHFMAGLVSIDESAFLVAASNGKNAPNYLRDLQAVKLKLWSAGRSFYLQRGYADKKSRTKHAERRVLHPAVSFLSFTTPETLAAATDSLAVSSGDLPRELVLVDMQRIDQRRPGPFTIPKSLQDACDWLRAAVAEPLADEMRIVIATPPDAAAALDEVMAGCNAREKQAQDLDLSLITRHFEKVQRIAGVLAVINSPGTPVMTAGMVEWAEAFVSASDIDTANYFHSRVHDDKRMADVERVRDMVERVLRGHGKPQARDKQAIAKGQVPWSFMLRLLNMAARDAAAALDHLEQEGYVRVSNEDLGGQRKAKVVSKVE